MNENDRLLKIGLSFIKNALATNRQLAAFAFAVIVKFYFTNSKYYKKSYTYLEVAKICQVSTKKAKQILNDVVEFGYAKWNKKGTILEFAKIRIKGGLSYKFFAKDFTNKKINVTYLKKNDTNINCISLKSVIDELRNILGYTHIKQKQYVDDIKTGFADVKDLSKAKKMSKSIVKYAINIESKVDRGISIESLMKVFGVKNRNKAIRLIDKLVLDGLIERKTNIAFIGYDYKNTKYNSNEFGVLFTYKNKLYQKYRNIYTIKDSVINRVCCN